jgi:hypothetical protein
MNMPNEWETEFLVKALRRSILAAYDRLIDARYRRRVSNVSPESEEAIEAEAVRLCRRP